MAILNIQDPPKDTAFSVFVLGFRPFFLAAGVFAVLSMAMWMAIFSFSMPFPLSGLAPFQWHAHEMIYGFTLSVVAGFLLTAIKNWTSVQTIQHRPLMLLFSLWLGARLCLLFGTDLLLLAAILDLSFNLLLVIAMLQPVMRVKQWKQLGIISKILLLGLFNGLFYLGALGLLEHGVDWGIYGGLMLLIALVFNMGRRVITFFIEKGVGYPVQLKNPRWLDLSSLFVFLAFAIGEVFFTESAISSYLAAILVVISAIRLYHWHTRGLWSKPLLWGLYGAFVSITIGLLLFALLPYSASISRSMAYHAFAFGGIALITISMMSRVTLGHTGRNIQQPSCWISIAQTLLVIGAIIRVFGPALLPAYYTGWILLAQLLWIISFSLFVVSNAAFLTRPRVDGSPG